MTHYDQQLAAGGWQREGGDAQGPAGWSYWSFADEEGERWRGMLLAIHLPTRLTSYWLDVRIETERHAGGGWQMGGGWTSWAPLQRP